MNRKVVVHTLGLVMLFEAIFMLLPSMCGIIYGEKETFAFLAVSFVTAITGMLFRFKTPENKTMYARDGIIIVALSWIIMSIIGAIPFVLTKTIPSFTDAFFETVSGFTTTGASILTEIESLPKCVLFWRSFTHWIGGMGVLVFLVAILPVSGSSNMHLMRAESPGPSVTKLVPKVKSTAKILYIIYTALTVIQIIFLLIGKMNLFDALTIAFGTAGTGGFAILNDSIASYSPYLQNVITVFMLLFGVNFTLFYLMLMRQFKTAFKSTELRCYLLIFAISTIMICANILPMYENISASLRHSAFQVSSVMTTTGFATADFNKWPEFSKAILVLIMFTGACAGSTGGGMKISRIIILFKSIAKELKTIIHPKSVHKLTLDGHPIEHETVRIVNVYTVSYFVIYALSVLLISIDNHNFTTNFTAVAATINNIGPGLDVVGPTGNFSSFSDFSKIVLIFDMLAGRLEIFPLLALFYPYTWKK